MNPLTLRVITIVSAGLLIFEITKGSYLVRLDSSNFVDSIIIIVAFTGLCLGICVPETQTNESAIPDAATSPAETAIPTTITAQAQSSEDGKSEGG